MPRGSGSVLVGVSLDFNQSINPLDWRPDIGSGISMTRTDGEFGEGFGVGAKASVGVQATFGSLRDLAGPGAEFSGHVPFPAAPGGGIGGDVQIGDSLDGSGGSLNFGPGLELSGGCSGPSGETFVGADDGGFFGMAIEDPDLED